MDSDQSGTVDRMEWVSYLAAPTLSIYQMGNKDYYDFELREMFEKYNKNKNGLILASSLRDIIKTDLGGYYN